MAWRVQGNMTVSKLLSTLRMLITGTAGDGYIEIPKQTVVPANATANAQRLFLDSTSSKLKTVDESGTVTNVGVSTLAGLSDVSLSTPTVNQNLSYNGSQWINSNTPVSVGNGVEYFFDDTASDIVGYFKIGTSPVSGSEIDDNIAVTPGSSPAPIESYASPAGGLGLTTINAGSWIFSIFANVSGGSTCTVQFSVYKRTAGNVETLLFSVNTPTLTTTITLYEVESVQPAFVVNTTDRLVIKSFATNTFGTSRTVHYYHDGTAHYSHVHTPLIQNHNDLSGLQGGSALERYHLTLNQVNSIGSGGTVNFLPNGNFESGITNASAYGEEVFIGSLSGSASFSKWNGVSYGFSQAVTGDVLCSAFDRSGNLWVGGNFTVIGGVAISNLAMWNGIAWVSMGTFDGAVNAIAVDANNNVYVGGTFTTINSVTMNRISYWNGSTWSTVGSTPGVTGGTGIYALCFTSDGVLWVGGDFSSVDGGAHKGKIVKWTGSAWVAVFSTPSYTDGNVYAICQDPASTTNVYIGGTFTYLNGVSNIRNRIARWNGGWVAVGTGMPDGAILALASDSLGQIWAGGSFTSAGGTSNTNKIAIWITGPGWTQLTGALSGPSSTVRSIWSSTGNVVVFGGDFTTINGNSFPYIAQYNGTAISTVGAGRATGTYTLSGMRRHPTAGIWGVTTNLALTAETTAPLDGTKSLKVSKPAVNYQGQGWALDFTLPLGYLNQVNEVTFVYQTNVGYTSGEIEVLLYNVTTGVRIFPLNTNSSSPLTLPAAPSGSGKQGLSFLPSDLTNTSYRLIFHIIGTSAASWNFWLDDVSVDPGQLVQGPTVGGWMSYVPTIVGMGGGANAVLVNARYKRVTDHVEILGTVKIGTGGDAGSVIAWSMPSGLTAKIPGSPYNTYESVGRFSSTASVYGAVLSNQNVNTLYFGNDAGNPLAANVTGAVIGNGNYLEFFASIPVNEFSVNQITGAEATEFASNSSSTDGDDTTSFVNGPQGGLIPTVATSATGASRTKRVQFTQPVQPTDYVVVEIQDSGVGPWIPVGQLYSYQPFGYQKSTGYGICWQQFSSTQFDVLFLRGGRLMSGTNYGDAGAAFPHNASDRWRVRKVSAPALVGHNIATTSQPVGLLQTGAIPAATSGAPTTTGNVGQVIRGNVGAITVTSAGGANVIDDTAGSLVLAPGNWMVMVVGTAYKAVGPSNGYWQANASIYDTTNGATVCAQEKFLEFTTVAAAGAIELGSYSMMGVVNNSTGGNLTVVLRLVLAKETGTGTGASITNIAAANNFTAIRLP